MRMKERIIPTYAFFESEVKLGASAWRRLQWHHRLYSYSVEEHIRLWVGGVMKLLGAEREQILQLLGRHPGILAVQLEQIGKQIVAMEEEGIARADVVRMLLRHPKLVSLSSENIVAKLRFLKEVMKRDVGEVLVCPIFLTLSLEQRIIPRFEMLPQEIRHTFALSTIFFIRDDMFRRMITNHETKDCAKTR
eukprot:TRINITY_DN1697_c0_g1_i4.p1 TRINITY_DN1697_c0_g1~~TRINITY_DN1697_c0_g1_i4.p1  ORF type:complete len:192 (-),score=40.93 TRINITY_DN1697_c0_g1_i4:42-617(-)